MQAALVEGKARDAEVTQPEQRLDAMAAWFAREHLGLVRFATLVCGDQHLAEDLVQEAFVRAYAAGAQVHEEFGRYTRKAIVNLSRSRFRRRAAEARAYSKHGSPDDSYTIDLRDDAIWNALLLLPVQQRAVIGLRFYEDLPEREIARVLGISQGGVKKHASRGIARLRELLGDRRYG